MWSNRKTSYKLPPTTITDKLLSQDSRRKKALEDQKRRRAQRFDSARQLDLFADLNLGPSDDEEDEAIDDKSASVGKTSGVAPFVSALNSTQPGSSVSAKLREEPSSPSQPVQGTNATPKKRHKRRRRNRPSKWADRCMYAELLEMAPDDAWSTNGSNDGLPSDLETGWVAVAPVPVGKRCLAITYQSSGTVGNSPNTTLRSRLLGKTLIAKFPSNLPALTILDCILDVNWRENGILHVLDVIKWKGQDVADCETAFRFWWRDTRLAELTANGVVTTPTYEFPGRLHSETDVHGPSPGDPHGPSRHFSYPTTFLPVPYHTDTSLEVLHDRIIPAARSVRSLNVQVPVLLSLPAASQEGGMEVDVPRSEDSVQATESLKPLSPEMVNVRATIQPDGLLLYVAEASYEMGTSPLSSWVPISTEAPPWEKDATNGVPAPTADPLCLRENPLDLFQQLVKRRLDRKASGGNSLAGHVVNTNRAHMDTEMQL